MASWPLSALLLCGALFRLALIAFGEAQDRLSEVRYTDIDYVVITDAARYVAQGSSPFDRATYRYSPLLAYLVLPNLWPGCSAWGKVLFSAGDIAVAWLIAAILGAQHLPPSAINTAVLAWLYNPFTATISTRGSCDALVSALLLLVLALLQRRRNNAAALAYGLAVHLRLYPIIYVPSIVLFLTAVRLRADDDGQCVQSKDVQAAADCVASSAPTAAISRLDPSVDDGAVPGHKVLHMAAEDQQSRTDRSVQLASASTRTMTHAGTSTSHLQQATGSPVDPVQRSNGPHRQQVLHATSVFVTETARFGLVSGGCFLLLGAAFASIYGSTFVREAFTHHLSRQDPRHNFAPHWYGVYLAMVRTVPGPQQGCHTVAGAGDDTGSSGACTRGGVATHTGEDHGNGACRSQSEVDADVTRQIHADTENRQSGLQHPRLDSSTLDPGKLTSLLQLVLLLALAWCYREDLPTAWLLQTVAFVALNKVCTAQYFVWYFCLLPLALPHMAWPLPRHLLLAGGTWLTAQLHWLGWAYMLEFQGVPAHLGVWAASIAFLAANAVLLGALVISIPCVGTFIASSTGVLRPSRTDRSCKGPSCGHGLTSGVH